MCVDLRPRFGCFFQRSLGYGVWCDGSVPALHGFGRRSPAGAGGGGHEGRASHHEGGVAAF